MNVRIAPILVGFIAVATLAACGAGSSSFAPPPGQSGPVSQATPTAGPTAPTGNQTSPPGNGGGPPANTSNVQMPAGQQAEAQNGLANFAGVTGLAGPGGITTLTTLLPNVNALSVRRSKSVHALSVGSCTNNQILTTSYNSNSGQTTYVLNAFYPVGTAIVGANPIGSSVTTPCTLKEYELDASLNTFGNKGISGFIGAGHQAYFAAAFTTSFGAQTQNQMASSALTSIYAYGFGGPSVTEILRGSAIGTGGNTTSAFSTECVITTASNTGQCGDGMLVSNSSPLSASLGTVIGMNYSSTGVQGITEEAAATGNLGSLTLGTASSYPFWALSGGTAPTAKTTASIAGTTITITDSANAAQDVITVGANGSLQGSIIDTNSHKTVATYTTDGYGVGSINYTNETTSAQSTGTMAGFLIL